jgi:type IV secretion system protein VirB5
MASTHKSTNYKPIEIENPFRQGSDKAYSDLLMDKILEMRWWRNIVGGGVLLMFIITFIFFVYTVSLQRTVPVLVNVMQNGEAEYLGAVKQTKTIEVPEAAIQYQARRFINNLRSISTDPQVLYNNIEDCYAMVTVSGEKVMTKELRADSPFEVVGKKRREVRIESTLKITDSTYQIDWNEVTMETGMTSQSRARLRALVTVKLLPTTDKTIQRNPLGIYIDSYSITML